MSNNCNHPTCFDSAQCRRPVKARKVYRILPKKGYRIPKKSAKRKETDKTYLPASRKLRDERPFCELQIGLKPEHIEMGIEPVCTRWTQGVHHPKGKATTELYLKAVVGPDKDGIACCNACNGWAEDNSELAKELGIKVPDYSSKLSKFKNGNRDSRD